MKARYILFAILSASLLFSGCNSENQWEKALGEAAPPDPYKQARGKIINEEKKKQEEQKIELAETATGQKTVHRAQYRPDLEKQKNTSQATLLIILDQHATCYEGKVRPYIDGRLVGEFDQSGKLEINVEPTSQELSIFDDVSVRRFPLNLTAGKREVITVKCDKRTELPAIG